MESEDNLKGNTDNPPSTNFAPQEVEKSKVKKSSEEGYVSPIVKTALKTHIGEKRAREEQSSGIYSVVSLPAQTAQFYKKPQASVSTEFVSSLPATKLPVYIPTVAAPAINPPAQNQTVSLEAIIGRSNKVPNDEMSELGQSDLSLPISESSELHGELQFINRPQSPKKLSSEPEKEVSLAVKDEDLLREQPSDTKRSPSPMDKDMEPPAKKIHDEPSETAESALIDPKNIASTEESSNEVSVGVPLEKKVSLDAIETALDNEAIESNDFIRIIIPSNIARFEDMFKTSSEHEKLELFQKRVSKLPVPRAVKTILGPAEPLNEWEKVKESAQLMDLPDLQRYVAEEILNQSPAIVVNDKRLKNEPRKFLGCFVYSSSQLLPQWTPKYHFSVFTVRVKSSDIIEPHPNKENSVWGTDIYTDDSDPLEIILHAGRFGFNQPEKASRIKFAGVDVPEINFESSKASFLLYEPGKDLEVTFQVLPRLVRYTGSTRNGVKSKTWVQDHDGESLQVLAVEHVNSEKFLKKNRKALVAKRALDRYEQTSNLGENKNSEFAFLKGSFSNDGMSNRSCFSSPSWYSRSTNPASLVTFAIGGNSDEEGVVYTYSNREVSQICFKYSYELLNYWPPYIERFSKFSLDYAADNKIPTGISFRSMVDKASRENIHAALQFENWPYWSVKVLTQNVVLETPLGEQIELRYSDNRELKPKEKTRSVYSIYYLPRAGSEALLFSNLKRDMIRFEAGCLDLVNLDSSSAVKENSSGVNSQAKKRRRELRIVQPEMATFQEHSNLKSWCQAVPTGFRILLSKFYYKDL